MVSTVTQAKIVAQHLLSEGTARVSVVGNGAGIMLSVRVQVGRRTESGSGTVEGAAGNWDDAWRVVERGVAEIVRANIQARAMTGPNSQIAAEACRVFGIAGNTRAAGIVRRWAEEIRQETVQSIAAENAGRRWVFTAVDVQQESLKAITAEYDLGMTTEKERGLIDEMMQRAYMLGARHTFPLVAAAESQAPAEMKWPIEWPEW